MEGSLNDKNEIQKVIKNVDNFLWEVTSYIKCSICYELYSKPYTTPCGHTFCYKCIQKLLYGLDNARSCPLCRYHLKRRESKYNPLLSKVAIICTDFPSAFKEDVLSLNPKLKDFTNDLLKSSKILDFTAEKEKTKCNVRKKSKLRSHMKVEESKIHANYSDSTCEEVNCSNDCNESLVTLKKNGSTSFQHHSDGLSTPANQKKLKRKGMAKGMLPESNTEMRNQNAGNDLTEKRKKVNKQIFLHSKQNCFDSGCDDPSALKSIFPQKQESRKSSRDTKAMIRFDYNKTNKPTPLSDLEKTGTLEITKTTESDPYDFIPSQRTESLKRRTKTRRVSRKHAPCFESIQSFTKDNVKKILCRRDGGDVKDENINKYGKSEDTLWNGDEFNVSTVCKTYSRPCAKGASIKLRDENNERVTDEGWNPGGDPKSSLVRDCPSPENHPERPSNVSSNSSDLEMMEHKMVGPNFTALDNEDTVGTDTDECVNSEGNNEAGRALNKLQERSNPRISFEKRGTGSPGWSRVNTLKRDFETANRKHRYTRKILNISGGEQTANVTKNKSSLQFSPHEILQFDDNAKENYQIDDISQSSDVLIGFDPLSNPSKEKDFKKMVEGMEIELKGPKNEVAVDSETEISEPLDDRQEQILCKKKSLVDKNGTSEAPVSESWSGKGDSGSTEIQKIIVRKRINDMQRNAETYSHNIMIKRGASNQRRKPTIKRKSVPLSLMGKIYKKKNTSIVFLQLGRLSRNLRSSRSTILKLVFPRNFPMSVKNRLKSTGIQTEHLESSSWIRNSTVELSDTTFQSQNKDSSKTMGIGVQTTQTILPMIPKEIQTSQNLRTSLNCSTNETNIDIENVMSGLPSQMFDKFDTPGYNETLPNNCFSNCTNDNENIDKGNMEARSGNCLRSFKDVELDSEIQCELNMTWAQTNDMKSDNDDKSKTNEKSEFCLPDNRGTNQDFGNKDKKPVESMDIDEAPEIIDLACSSEITSKNGMQCVINNINLDLARARAANEQQPSVGRRSKSMDVGEESDTDIFIEQTPPRIRDKNLSMNENFSANESQSHLLQREQVAKVNTEESFLILSECQNAIPDSERGIESPVGHLPKSDKIQLFTEEPSVGSAKDKVISEVAPQQSLSIPISNNVNMLSQVSSKRECRSNTTSPNLTQPSRRICIVASGLKNRALIDKFVRKFNVQHLSNPRNDMTHLVVGLHENEDDELVPYCTPKFLYAMAHKKWIVTESWIEACLDSNCIVNEEPYESVDPTGGNGCSAARKSKGLLLENCEVYLYGNYETISKEEFSALIQYCGGNVVPHPNNFSRSANKIRMILADRTDSQEDSIVQVMMKKYQTLVMSRDVIIMSIQKNELCNFTPFLLHSITQDEFWKFGYPYHLVNNENENKSQLDSESDDQLDS